MRLFPPRNRNATVIGPHPTRELAGEVGELGVNVAAGGLGYGSASEEVYPSSGTCSSVGSLSATSCLFTRRAFPPSAAALTFEARPRIRSACTRKTADAVTKTPRSGQTMQLSKVRVQSRCRSGGPTLHRQTHRTTSGTGSDRHDIRRGGPASSRRRA